MSKLVLLRWRGLAGKWPSCFALAWRGAAIFFAVAVTVNVACAIDRQEAVKIGREYLGTNEAAVQIKLAAKLAEYQGEVQPVVEELARQEFEPVKAGYLPERHFSVAAMRKKHPDDLLYFQVPATYRPERAAGLIVYLHGGGKTSSRRAPRLSMNVPELGDEESEQLGDIFAATGMVAVGPSAPWNENSSVRWCLEEADEYLADVIAECKSRFHIDADRVFLVGHSMGGFGAYHQAQRQPDRFAAVVVNAGSWSRCYLPMLQGTPLCIIQGVNDARAGERWHYTDVEYARWTDKLLSERGLEHTYYEHAGKHAARFGREYMAKCFQASQSVRRDAYAPQIAIASPVGYSRSCSFPVQHNRWLTLDEAADGEIEFDELFTNGEEDFDKWRLDHRVSRRRGAAIDAVNKGDNTIELKTQNVKRLTVWIHAKMVDVNKPVTILVNGKIRFAERVTPSLATALESYLRRGDWGLVYPMKVELGE